MNKKSGNTSRVVRTGAKGKKVKKPLPPVLRVLKAVFSVLWKVVLTTVLVFTITGCIVGTALTIYVMEFIDSDATIDLKSLKMNYTALVYAKDKDGNDVEVQQLNQKENRIWVDLDQIPQNLQDAVKYTEDERFDTHAGVDFKRTIAAFANMLLSRDRSFGGSTITQQLIKNINGDIDKNSRTIEVKIQEIVTAMNLERHFSKPQIMEAYLNYISLDNNINGVQAGAKYYFDKDVSELSLDECAALAVISKSPSGYNPIKNPEANQRRRQYAYEKMLEFGAITQAEYDAVYDKPLVLAEKNQLSDNTEKKEYQNWFIDSVIEEIIADLCEEYNYSKDHATQLLYTGGYSIYTTMEIETQKILEDYFANENNFKKEGTTYKYELPQAYMLIMNYEGNVVATVGGKGEKTGDRLLNRSITSQRPAGSTIKPLAVYTPAFESDIITWSTIMDDNPVQKVTDEKTKEERDWPSNYNKKYEGFITIIDALKVSKNTIPVRLINMMQPQTSFDFVYEQLGLKSLVPTGTHNNVNAASLALGDGGSTLLELTAAYQIFGNGGYFIEPQMYTKVLDADGKVVLDTTKRKKTQVMSSQTAYIMNRGLWHVVNDGSDPEHRGSGLGAKLSQWETVGKTGTSNDRKDLLFMGLTPYYVAGIRYGHDNNDIIESTGIDHKVVWNAVMEKVHEGKNPANFELNSEGVVEYEYCTESGMLAHTGCPIKKAGYYKIDGGIPSTCTLHSYTGGINPGENGQVLSGDETSSTETIE